MSSHRTGMSNFGSISLPNSNILGFGTQEMKDSFHHARPSTYASPWGVRAEPQDVEMDDDSKEKEEMPSNSNAKMSEHVESNNKNDEFGPEMRKFDHFSHSQYALMDRVVAELTTLDARSRVCLIITHFLRHRTKNDPILFLDVASDDAIAKDGRTIVYELGQLLVHEGFESRRVFDILRQRMSACRDAVASLDSFRMFEKETNFYRLASMFAARSFGTVYEFGSGCKYQFVDIVERVKESFLAWNICEGAEMIMSLYVIKCNALYSCWQTRLGSAGFDDTTVRANYDSAMTAFGDARGVLGDFQAVFEFMDRCETEGLCHGILPDTEKVTASGWTDLFCGLLPISGLNRARLSEFVTTCTNRLETHSKKVTLIEAVCAANLGVETKQPTYTREEQLSMFGNMKRILFANGAMCLAKDCEVYGSTSGRLYVEFTMKAYVKAAVKPLLRRLFVNGFCQAVECSRVVTWDDETRKTPTHCPPCDAEIRAANVTLKSTKHWNKQIPVGGKHDRAHGSSFTTKEARLANIRSGFRQNSKSSYFTEAAKRQL